MGGPDLASPSQGLCEPMGDTPTCRSTPEVGSTFRFSVLIRVFDATSDTPLTAEIELCIDREWILVEEHGKKKERSWVRHDRDVSRQKSDLEKGIPEESPETPGAPAIPVPINDIWFAAVELAKNKRDQILLDTNTSMVEKIDRPRILIVDDVRVNRMILRKMVEALDFEVELAEDGEKAVKHRRFTINLMVVMMPV